MTSEKAKTFVENEQISPLRNRFTFHLILYILFVVLVFWEMMNWENFHDNTIRDRAIVFALWGLILVAHYIYLRFSNAITALQRTVEAQRHALSSSLFTPDEETVFMKEERTRRLQK